MPFTFLGSILPGTSPQFVVTAQTGANQLFLIEPATPLPVDQDYDAMVRDGVNRILSLGKVRVRAGYSCLVSLTSPTTFWAGAPVRFGLVAYPYNVVQRQMTISRWT